ncbi:MAG: alpha-galactosidase [Fimbriimonas sp.]|nr:alpha-galactosidase [Fimbriimonas sp.]
MGVSLAHSQVSPTSGFVSSADTRLSVHAQGGQIVLKSVASRLSPQEWSSRVPIETHLVSLATYGRKRVALAWRVHRLESSKTERVVRITFKCDSPKLVAVSEWKAALRSGPIEHSLTITNAGLAPVEIPLQKSLAWSFDRSPNQLLEAWWVEKPAGRPSPTGIHADPLGPDFSYTVLSEPYESDQRAYSEDWHDRDAVPWVSVHDRSARSGWYAGVEFSGRVSIQLKPHGPNRVDCVMGIADEPEGAKPFRTVIRPGEAYALPTVFLGTYKGTVDDGCNQMTRWVDTALRPKAIDTRYPLLTLNSWGSGMAVDSNLARSMMTDAAELGIEQFHIDAGWFRTVGDWRPNPAKFPEGIAKTSSAAHALGLRFGLWIGWTQGGIGNFSEDRQMALSVHDPLRRDWFAQNYSADWKPADFVGADLCMASADAIHWCTSMLSRAIDEYHIDMLEHDQRMIVDECIRKDHGHTTSKGDIAYRAALGYYQVYDTLRKQHPDLMFEDCVNGGRVIDFGVVKRVHYISIADSYFPLANRRAIFDMTYVVPAAMCECYVMEIPIKSLGEFKSMLRSGLMGWCSIMQDPAKWSPEERNAATREFTNYKKRIRPLIRFGNVFHVSERPDGVRWDGMQFASQDGMKSILFAFRGSTTVGEHTYRLQGLNPNRRYRVEYEDGDLPAATMSGSDILNKGIAIHLGEPDTSQLVFLTAD